MHLFSFIQGNRAVLILLIGFIFTSCAPSPISSERSLDLVNEQQNSNQQTSQYHLEVIADPFEPVNRGINQVNEGFLLGVMRPTTRFYRAIVPPAGRQSISNFDRNINYPGRVINHVLQGRWQGATDETIRFVTNTTVGLAGLFDPASFWNIPKSDADFAQTFYKWGWSPNNFVMLPILGPSDDLHFAGFVADKIPQPTNYYPPLSPITGATTFNRLSDRTESIVRFTKTEADAYASAKYLWTHASKEYPPNWSLNGPIHDPSLQTLKVATIRLDDPEFAFKSKEGKVRSPHTGRMMKFNYWLQKEHAPLVYIAPGIGSHLLSSNTLAIAENLYQNGYSVVTTIGTFHPDFMENVSTAKLPSYPPVDCHDLLVYLTTINQHLERKHSGKIGQRALVGFSLGAFQTLYLAAQEPRTKPELLTFERYVAINPPINLRYANKKLDSYLQAPLEWPSEERQARANNALHKAALYPFLPPNRRTKPLFDSIESRYLVGLSFRLALRSSIYSSQYRHNMGIIKTPLNNWRRDEAYSEILNYSFDDYINIFALPYYNSRGISEKDFQRESSLRAYQKSLKIQKKVRVMSNRDDFLINSKDVSWLNSTFGSSRLTLFPNGGHIGNLSTPPVKEAILKSLDGLKSN